MKRIIEDVLQVEERVGVILKQARDKAAEIRRSAEKEISEKMSDAKQQAREIVQATVEDAKKEAELIAEEKIKQAEKQKDALFNDRTDAIDNLVDNICSIILTTKTKM
jgi:vacuolar-type H+-ATPase subunit H